MWNNNVVKTPSGKTGFAVTPDSKDVTAGIVEDVNKTYGRGIARVRPTNYFQYTIWTEKEKMTYVAATTTIAGDVWKT